MRSIWFFVLCVFGPCLAWAGPIYVTTDAKGVIKFSSKPPAAGVTAKVFTAKSAGFSWYRGIGWNPRRVALEKNKYRDLIDQAAKNHGVSAALIRAVIHVESDFEPKALSPKGAQGLMQLMPITQKRYGVQNAYDAAANIEAGTKHLSYLLRQYKHDVRRTLAAYNAGQDAIEKYSGIPPFRETQQYVHRVMELYRRYLSQG